MVDQPDSVVRGQFTHLGRQDFPLDSGIDCDCFEWACPRKFGQFKLRLICPVNEKPRRFFLEPLLEDLRGKKPSSFVDRACACGSRICAWIDRDAGFRDRYAELWQAIFRNRHTGHVRVARSFRHRADFVHLGTEGPELVVPSPIPKLAVPKLTKSVEMLKGKEQTGRMRKVSGFNEIVRQFAPEEKSHYTVSDLIGYLQKSASGTSSPLPTGDEQGLGLLDGVGTRGLWDHVTVEGIGGAVDRTEFNALCRMLAPSLINSPDFDGDLAMVHEHRDAFLSFAERIRKKLTSCRERSKFDQWLKNEREHGFHRLLSRTWKNQLGPQSIQLAKASYRALLWQAYQVMSHSWGLLMLIVWTDFCNDSQIQPNAIEQALFRRMHAPQYRLAGLPIAFFSPPQLLFVARPLLEIWQPERVCESEAYQPIARLLALYGHANIGRRKADRDTKRNVRHPRSPLTVEPEISDLPATDTVGEPETLPLQNSIFCNVCGQKLQLYKCLSSLSDSTVAARLYCARCDKYLDCRIRPSNF